MPTDSVIIFIALLLVAGASYVLGSLQKENEMLKDAMERKRHTWSHENSLMDAMAIILNSEFSIDELEARLRTERGKLARVRDILGDARKGPLPPQE